jgi:hypothetical protein
LTRRMSIGVLVALSTLNGGCIAAESAPSCIVELAAPTYPLLAARARLRVSGVQAIARIENGHVTEIRQVYPPETTRFAPLFKDAIEQSVRRSTFRDTCHDRTETITYDFVDIDPAYRDPPDEWRVRFVPPNKIVVASTGVTIDFSKEAR